MGNGVDKDLITRIILVVVVVAAYLVASHFEFYNAVFAPLAVVTVAVVMFWPRKKGSGGTSPRKELKNIRQESAPRK